MSERTIWGQVLKEHEVVDHAPRTQDPFLQKFKRHNYKKARVSRTISMDLGQCRREIVQPSPRNGVELLEITQSEVGAGTSQYNAPSLGLLGLTPRVDALSLSLLGLTPRLDSSTAKEQNDSLANRAQQNNTVSRATQQITIRELGIIRSLEQQHDSQIKKAKICQMTPLKMVQENPVLRQTRTPHKQNSLKRSPALTSGKPVTLKELGAFRRSLDRKQKDVVI